MRQIVVCQLFFLFLSSVSLAEDTFYSAPSLYREKKLEVIGFLEGVGSRSRFGFMRAPGEKWQIIPRESPPTHIKNWNLYFDGKIRGSLGDILKGSGKCESMMNCHIKYDVPNVASIWQKLIEFKLVDTALQVDGFFFNRPFLILNREELSDPDHWEPFDPKIITDEQNTLIRNAMKALIKKQNWIIDRTQNKSCPPIDESTSTIVTNNFSVSDGSRDGGRPSRQSYIFFKKRPLHFISKKRGFSVVQARILFHPALRTKDCNVFEYVDSESGSDDSYRIYPESTRFAFLINHKKKTAIFIGHDLNMVDSADFDGNGISDLIVTASQAYKIVNPVTGAIVSNYDSVQP
jgi:hypothetical protein